MDEQPQLENDTKKDANNNITVPNLSTKTEAPTNDHAIIYICSPNQTKQKQLESVLHDLNPRCSVYYYTDNKKGDDDNDDCIKMTCSEENDLMAIGSIRFPTTALAEKAYALLNGTPLMASSPSTTIQLRYNTFSRLYRDTTPTPLIIQHLPKNMTMSSIYDLLREFGPIAQCRRLNSKESDDNDDEDDDDDRYPQVQLTSAIENERVTVHYFLKENATQSQLKLNNTSLDDSDHPPITVIAGIPNHSKPNVQQMQGRTPGNSIPAETSPTPSNKAKRKEKNRLSQQLLHHDEQQRQQSILQVEIKPTMDLCNLYVKGLSLSMTSTELFNLFKPYGRIISARVMANDKNVSKGFGFVSFSQPIEAASALVHLHPHYSILFHEPKVPRSDHDIQQQYWSLVHSPLASYFYSTSITVPVEPMMPPTHAPVLPTAAAVAVTTTTPSPPPPPPPPTHTQPPAVPYYYYPPPFTYPTAPYYYHPPVYYAPYPYPPPPTFGPSSSSSSSGGSTEIQRSDMQLAVQLALTNDKQQQEIVDTLMALEETEKRHCLEDTAYLKEKLDQLLQQATEDP